MVIKKKQVTPKENINIPKNLPEVQTPIDVTLVMGHPVWRYPELRDEQKQFLFCFYHPDLLGMSIQSRCKNCGISKQTYYNWMADKTFATAAREVFNWMVETTHPEVLLSIRKQAANSKDPRWAKLYLERFDKEYVHREQIETKTLGVNLDVKVDKSDYDNIMSLINKTK